MLRDHEKLIAFLALGAGTLVLVAMAVFFPPQDERIIRVLDTACGGFLLALGAATNALFRSKTDALMQSAVDKIPPLTGDAAPQQTGGAPWTRD